jgi:hypothetical protein
MNKNSYALTRDLIFGCDYICGSLCPKRAQHEPCFPTPCCGDKHWEKSIYDVRETSAPQDATLSSLVPGQVVEMTHS